MGMMDKIFVKLRKRLYWLTVSFYAFALALLLAAIVLGEGTEPCCRWITKIVGFVILGLPANLVELWGRYPLPMSLVLLIPLLLAVTDRTIRVKEDEFAFQKHQLIWANVPPPQPTLVARCVDWVSLIFPPMTVILFLASAIYLLVTASIVFGIPNTNVTFVGSNSSEEVLDKPCILYAVGTRRLNIGESIKVVIGARLVRNETGLLVGKDERYEARYLYSQDWKDGNISAESWGIEFKGIKGLLAPWFEWVRPYPEGGWFQVVGRVETDRDVFPVLGAGQVAVLQRFTAPRDGELVLLVNDVWYANNSGYIIIEIRRIK